MDEDTLDNCENSLPPEVEQAKIIEVRRLIGPQTGKPARFCSEPCIRRYLRARNWNVKKAVKMLKATLEWRLEYKPEEIQWEDVAVEGESGKIYRSSYQDKYGRPVLVMRPRRQNSKSIKGQIRHLVYCMENAIMNLPPGQEQMVWLIDFLGFSVANVSLNVTRETAKILQDHYPERLAAAILYNPPKLFDPILKMAKPLMEPKTANKIKLIYPDDQNTSNIMDELFDMELMESVFGGKDDEDFDINKYAARMREDDKKNSSFWRADCSPPPSLLPPVEAAVSHLDMVHSDSDPDLSDSKGNAHFYSK